MSTSQVDGGQVVESEPRSGLVTFLSVAAPNATAFFSSMCIMAVELVAGRLIARHVGNSIYTWTSVIGVVLAGIAAGNWTGGRLADRYKPTNALGVLFALASFVCLAIPGLNTVVGDWSFLWKQDWAVRIAAHVFLVFFLPSTALGCIGPLAAKMALDLGRKVGRTVGNVYAWGALGSIVGTFLTGFILIARMGTIAVLLSVAGFLALLAVLYGARSLFPYVWAGIALCLIFATTGSWGPGRRLGIKIGFVPERSASILYVDESQYSFIQIEQEDDPPSTRTLSLDHLIHSYLVMDQPDNLQYDYEKVYAGITRSALGDRPKPSALFIGGGGFVFPRYMLLKWPGSYIEVAEIDPRVTKAAHEAFALARDAPIHIFNLDARNHIDDLLERRRRGEPVPAFDLIYGDAFNHYSVPYHLTTLEFNQKLRALMSPNGVYMINLIDIYSSGLFLGAELNTFQKCFPYVYAFSTVQKGPTEEKDRRDTFVLVGSMRPLVGNILGPGVEGSELRPEHFEALRKRSRNIVLTDDYAPVEQMLAPVIRMADKDG